MTRWHAILFRAGVLVFLAAGWEAVSRTGIADPRLVPPFSVVAERLGALIVTPDLLYHLGVTLAEVVLAFVLVTPIGVGVGLLLAENAFLSRAFRSLFYFLASVPKSIFLPMFILVFGIGFAQKVAFGVFQALFVLVISTIAAVASVQPELVRLAKVYGAPRWAIYREIYWPSMLPVIVEGLRLGMIFNITGVLFAEMYASRSGLGAQIAIWGRNFDMPSLFAGVLIAALLSIIVNESLRVYERRVGAWRK